jgi:hypothetical protein
VSSWLSFMERLGCKGGGETMVAVCYQCCSDVRMVRQFAGGFDQSQSHRSVLIAMLDKLCSTAEYK